MEERTKETQEVVRPVQVGGRRELVLQRVVVWSEFPAQYLRQTKEEKLKVSGCHSGGLRKGTLCSASSRRRTSLSSLFRRLSRP